MWTGELKHLCREAGRSVVFAMNPSAPDDDVIVEDFDSEDWKTMPPIVRQILTFPHSEEGKRKNVGLY